MQLPPPLYGSNTCSVAAPPLCEGQSQRETHSAQVMLPAGRSITKGCLHSTEGGKAVLSTRREARWTVRMPLLQRSIFGCYAPQVATG